MKQTTAEIISSFQDWVRILEEENLLLSFKGEFNRNLINAVLLISSDKQQLNENNALVKNRIFSVIVECLQNICKHGADDMLKSESKPGIILISKQGQMAIISVGNLMLNSEIDHLKQKIDNLKKLSKEELKAHAKSVLLTTKLSTKSGAGLGLITIVRKSENVDYEIKKIDENVSFFSLQVSVSTQIS